MTTAKMTARRSPRKRPSPEAIEIAHRVNTLPKEIQRHIAKIAKNGDINAHSDETAPRIRAFLASMRPTRGVMLNEASDESFHRGRAVIEKLAICSVGTELPAVIISLREVADVLFFLAAIGPVDLKSWWDEPIECTSAICGYHSVLNALEESIRRSIPS
jgi:hypothetical protein